MNASLKLGLAVIFMLGAVGIDRPNAQTTSDRAKVLELLAKGDAAGAEKIMTELQAQLKAVPTVPGLAPAADALQVYFEELKHCGFYPQQTRLECVIEIKRNGGYTGQVGAVGSMEHVYFCVDWFNPSGGYTQYESAGQGSVQMHDGPGTPPWFYAVYRDFNLFGGPRTSNSGASTTTVTTAPSLNVKAILSWGFAPTGCNYIPVWGNILFFQIRMDPIR